MKARHTESGRGRSAKLFLTKKPPCGPPKDLRKRKILSKETYEKEGYTIDLKWPNYFLLCASGVLAAKKIRSRR